MSGCRFYLLVPHSERVHLSSPIKEAQDDVPKHPRLPKAHCSIVAPSLHFLPLHKFTSCFSRNSRFRKSSGLCVDCFLWASVLYHWIIVPSVVVLSLHMRRSFHVQMQLCRLAQNSAGMRCSSFYWMHKFRKSKHWSTALAIWPEILSERGTKYKYVLSVNPTHPCWDDTSVSVALSDGITVIVGRMTLFRW